MCACVEVCEYMCVCVGVCVHGVEVEDNITPFNIGIGPIQLVLEVSLLLYVCMLAFSGDEIMTFTSALSL